MSTFLHHIRQRGVIRGAAVLAGALGLLAAPESGAQDDPTLIGAGQRPYVLIVMDTSASMEFSNEGDQRYPCYDREIVMDNLTSCTNSALSSTSEKPPTGSLFEWEPDGRLTTLSGVDLLGGNMTQGATTSNPNDDDDAHFPENAIEMVGPCRVWVSASNGGNCNRYERPSWYANNEDLHEHGGNKAIWRSDVNAMRGRYNTVGNNFTAGDEPERRLEDFNQPRHVQIKEILTGDMILRPRDATNGTVIRNRDDDWDPRAFGPGCFFVPRMFGARIGSDSYKICAREITNSGGNKELRPRGDFEDLEDYDDPRPHLQEVFDYQLPTGLMDSLADTVIFSIATFDSDPGRYDGGSIDPNNNDGSPSENISRPSDFGPQSAVSNESGGKYNLGIYKVVGPTTLDFEGGLLRGLSSFSQLALVDAGYVQETEDARYTIDPAADDNAYDVTFPKGLKNYLDNHYMGQFLMSKATPLAAAVRDVHVYFVNGQRAFDRFGNGSISNPIQDDVYKECRAKHVLLLTDGFPEPEIQGPAGFGNLGADRLTPAFGYIDLNGDGDVNDETGRPQRYPYSYTEDEIMALRGEPALALPPGTDPKFETRLHVVGLNTVRNAAEVDQVRRKLGRMALAGGTCALFYLIQSEEGRKLVPNTLHPDGECLPEDNCLVPQITAADAAALTVPFNFPPNGPSMDMTLTYDSISECTAPALILERNDQFIEGMGSPGEREARDDLTKALQLIFNEVVNSSGGVSSRTRASITNVLDFGPEQGQFRLFSGVEVSTRSLYWGGLLNRQPDLCSAGMATCGDEAAPDDPGVCVWPLHEEITLQVRPASGTESGFVDNRRIFTSELVSEPANLTSGFIPDIRSPMATEQIRKLFPTDGRLIQITDNPDEFLNEGAAMFDANHGQAAHGGQALKTRVPFRLGALTELEVNSELNQMSPYAMMSLENVDNSFRSLVIGTEDFEEGRRTVWTVRGHDPEKRNNVLGAILNSNPVTVGPPSLDLPIESYQLFREKFRSRPTTTFVATLDGLLHAIYTGERPNGELFVRELMPTEDDYISPASNETPGPVRDGALGDMSTRTQREAWAFAPAMLRTRYAQFNGRQPNLMDGTPVIQDVRLCDPVDLFNLNYQACGVPDGTAPSPENQWRSVLVQGLGVSGAGYFAMDVTRLGGFIDDDMGGGELVPPDPVMLWEFSPKWEARQIRKLQFSGERSRFAGDSSTQASDDLVTDCGFNPMNDPLTSDELPFLGLSVSEAAIANIALQIDPGDPDTAISRPVAVFTAGRPEAGIQPYAGCEEDERSGHAVYVVDLQTGSLLRRFVEYADTDGSGVKRFEVHLEGTPVLYDGRPGSIASRGFVGDASGRLFRMNLNSANPNDWTVQLMYDPCSDDTIRGEATAALAPKGIDATDRCMAGVRQSPFGVSSFPPEVALDDSRNVIVVYGLGDRTDTSPANSAQAVIAIQDDFTVGAMGDLQLFPRKRFARVLEGGEKLTGRPTIFNSGVYFTSYKTDLLNPCTPGKSRIWGLGFNPEVDMMGNTTVTGLFDPVTYSPMNIGADTVVGPADPAGNFLWIGPDTPTLIRGVTIAFPKTCAQFDPSGTGGLLEGADDPPPQLIATTGGASPNSKFGQGSNTGTSKDNITRFVLNLKRPTTQTVPLSWTLIAN